MKRVDGLSEEGLIILNDVGETLGLPCFTSRTQMTLQSLRDAFYAMIIVCTPDLPYLSMEVEPEYHGRDMDIGRKPAFVHVASSYVDWRLDRILQHNQPLQRLATLEEIKICSVIKRCGLLDQSKSIVGLLQLPTLRKFTTDVFIPENPDIMPNTSIKSLNISNLIEEGKPLDKSFFANCHQLTNLAAAATKVIAHVSDPMVLFSLSSILTSLKLYSDRYGSNSHYTKNYLSCLANLESACQLAFTQMRHRHTFNSSQEPPVFDLEELMESGETLATSLSSSVVDP